MKREPIGPILLCTTLLLCAALGAVRAAGSAPLEGKSQESRGEEALRASFYFNTVPTMVEMVDGLKKDVLDVLELDTKRRTAAEKALAEVWTESRIYGHAAAAIEKQLPPDILDAAIAQMTPEVQALLRAGIIEASPGQAQAWLAVARKHPDVKVREALARRIAAHMPQPDAFKELIGQAVEAMGDTAQVITGTDEVRLQLRTSLMEGLEPAIRAMGKKEAMTIAAVVAYREQSTPEMKLLADALDSDAGSQLQGAAARSLVSGAKATRQELVAQLQRDLKRSRNE